LRSTRKRISVWSRPPPEFPPMLFIVPAPQCGAQARRQA
jgi:hypothetical protein